LSRLNGSAYPTNSTKPTPLVGSPALRAGIRPGDRFLRIGAEDVSQLGLPEVSARLKGPPGTKVDVVVQRGEEEVAMEIRRATIELESVIGDYRDEDDQWVYRLRDHPSIAYVRLTGFGEKTVDELRSVLTELNNDFAALIFDMRGNGGGLLDAAIDVSDMFLSGGEIVSTRTRGGAMEDQFSAQTETLVDPDKPMAVLVDGNSASASEIVAAALQDHGRAAIVGERTYGKGTVQNVIPLQYGRSALRLTVARFYRPNGESLQREIKPLVSDQVTDADSETTDDDANWGVQPDDGLKVLLDEETKLQLLQQWQQASYPSLSVSKDSDQHRAADADKHQSVPDPQLERAVEHLQQRLGSRQTKPAAA